MRWMGLPLAVAALAAAGLQPSASASGHGLSYVEVDGGQALTSRLLVSGSVTVDFHGEAAAGCSATHMCNVAGRVRWNPAGRADLLAFSFRERGLHLETGFLIFGTGSSTDPSPMTTSARVRRTDAPESLCADGAGQDASVDLASRTASLEVRIMPAPSQKDPSSEFLRTRCAGPFTSDVAGLLPVRRVGERALKRGGRTLNFAADKPFSAHGLVGRVHSTVAVHILGQDGLGDGGWFGSLALPQRTVRRRALDVTYRLEKVGGRVVAAVNGRRNPDSCGPLDSCGVIGAVTLSPTASSGAANLNAVASLRRSQEDLRRALGLAPGRLRSGVQRSGDIEWDVDSGHVVSALSRGGTPACTDSVPIGGGGAVSLTFVKGHVRATYQGGGSDALRTRCPGPSADDLSGTVASGTFPVSVFRHRRVTLRLREGNGYSGPGYSGRTHSTLTVVLRRVRIHGYVLKDVVDDESGHSRPF